VLNDVRVAVRQHVRQPGFALTVVLTLALTVGATTAVFAVVNCVLVRALPFASPEQLVWIASVRPDNPSAPFTLPEFMDYRSQARSLTGLAAYANWSASLAGDGITERLQGARMSANAFDVLGVAPAAGRLLVESDDRADAPRVVVLSHRLWLRQFGGAADIAGKTVRINAESYVIVGVLPARFPLPLPGVDVITPLAPDRDPLRHLRNSVNFLRMFGRLGPTVDANTAQAELTSICRSLRQQFPAEYARKDGVAVVALHETLVGDHRLSMQVLFAAVLVVMTTALANLVSLALVRANGRRAELSMRLAIGASRLRLARHLAIEAWLLAVCGCGLGLVVAVQLIAATRGWAPASLPRLDEVTVDGTGKLFVLAVAVIVTALLTAAPLLSVAGGVTGEVLRLASRGGFGDQSNRRIRNAMVVAEIAAAVVLVLATLMLVQSVRRLQDVPLGFSPDGVFQARVSIPPTYRSPDDVARFYERLSNRLQVMPAVRQLGVISVAPLSGLLVTVPFSIAGESTGERDRLSANLRAISPGYLATAGTRLLQGRSFSEHDSANSPHVALVSAALSDRVLSGNAIGRRLMIDDNNHGPRPVEIVGVIENVRQAALDLPPALDIYVPLRQLHADGVSQLRNNQFWTIKTDLDPAAFRATFLEQLRAVDPDAAVSSVGSMRQYVDAWLGPRRFNLGLFAAFALTSMMLAVLGLYGLVSYTVSQRTAEIGLRMAIGATQGQVRRLILVQAVKLGFSGAALGLVIAGLSWPILSTMVKDVSISAAAVATTSTLLIAVMLLAAWLPARRAAGVDPALALRGQ
jgi:predicted permease